jgi:hypothetical protein
MEMHTPKWQIVHEKLKPEQFGHSIPEYDGLFCI